MDLCSKTNHEVYHFDQPHEVLTNKNLSLHEKRHFLIWWEEEVIRSWQNSVEEGPKREVELLEIRQAMEKL